MISVATKDQALDVLRADGVVERLSVKPGRLKDLPYLMVNKMLLVLIDRGNDVEVHIASKKMDWKDIHSNIQEALSFIRSLGYNRILTTVRKELVTTANLIKKHGFIEIEPEVYQWA